MGDLSLGSDNWTDTETTLNVGSGEGTLNGDCLLWVRPGILDPNFHRNVDGIRAEAYENGIALRGEAHTFDIEPTGDEKPFPPSGTGVEGKGQTGVRGLGTVAGVLGRADGATGVMGIGSIGLRGRGDDGYGAVLSSHPKPHASLIAQLKIEPLRMSQTAERRPAEPTEAVPEGMRLPANAEAGELLMTVNDYGAPTLWLCVQTAESVERPAQWCEILLGSAISGTA
jgi:hypothetical protein